MPALPNSPGNSHRKPTGKSRLRMRATAADAAAICSAVKKLAKAMFRPLNKKASLNQSMNSSVTATTFYSSGRKIFNSTSGYRANTPYSMSPMPKTILKASPRNRRARAKFRAPKLALTNGDRESLMA